MNSIHNVRYTWIALGSIVSAALGSGGYALLNPAFEESHRIEREIAVTRHLEDTKDEVLACLSQTSHDYLRAKMLFDQIQQRSRPELGESTFLQWINEQSESVGFEVKDFRPSGRDVSGELLARSVMISLQCPYQAGIEFLNRLRHCPQMNRVTIVEFIPRDEKRLTFSVTLNLLLFTEKPAQHVTPNKSLAKS